MYNIWYNFFLDQFFDNVLPTITWQVQFMEIASIVMSCLVVVVAVSLIFSIVCFILNFARGLFR